MTALFPIRELSDEVNFRHASGSILHRKSAGLQ